MTTEKPQRGAPGAKAAITTASLAATLAGWAWLANSGTEDRSTTTVSPAASAAAPSKPARGLAPARRKPAARTRSS
jgi:hypothetical protein